MMTSRWGLLTCLLAGELVLAAYGDRVAAQDSAPAVLEGLSAEDRAFTEELIAKAKEEGELFLNWQRYNDIMPEWEAGFEKMYGIEVELVHTPNPDGSAGAAQVRDEFAAGRESHSDVVEGLNARQVNMLNSGAVPAFEWDRLPHISPEMLEGDGRAVIYAHVMPGISYNTETVAPEDVPKNAWDVINKGLLEKYSVAATVTASLVDSLYTDFVDQNVWGWERACEYNKLLGKGVAGLMNSGEVARIASGEFDMLVFDTGQETPKLAAEGAPIGLALLADALFLRPGYLTVPAIAPNPAMARLWVDYIVSPEAQAIMFEAYKVDSHHVKGSQSLPGYQAILDSGAKPVLLDIAVLSTFTEEEEDHRSELARQLIRGEDASCDRLK